MLKKIAAASPENRIQLHLVQLGIALDCEHSASLVSGYVNSAFTVAEVTSSVSDRRYVIKLAPNAEYVIGVDCNDRPVRVCIRGPAGVIFCSPKTETKPHKTRPTIRTTTELLTALLDAPIVAGSSVSLRDAPSITMRDGYMYHTYGCATDRTSASPNLYHPFQLYKLYRGIPNLTNREKLRVQSWRYINLDGAVPTATSWWETTSGLPDDPDWGSIPLDRVALLLASLAETRPSHIAFDRDALNDGIIVVRDVAHLIRFSPALTSCKKQIAALEGLPFVRPLAPR